MTDVLERGLQRRVALSFALLCGTLILLQGIVAHVVFEGKEDALVNQILSQEMDRVAARYARDPGAALSQDNLFAAYAVRDAASRERVPAFARLEPGLYERYVGDQTWHVAVRDVAGARLYVLFDASHHESRVREFRWFLIGSLVVGCLVAVWIGSSFAARLVGPLTTLTGAIDRFAPGTSATEEDGRAQDELTRLVKAFNRYENRVEELIAREKEFTANASHELRTPLTALRTSCEMLALDEGISEKSRGRLQAMLRSIDDLAATLQASLSLARDGTGHPERLRLRESIEELLTLLLPADERDGVRIDIAVPENAEVTADRHALQMLLRNLLRNAVSFAGAGMIRIGFGDGRLSIRDSGPSIPAADLPYIFDRYFSARRVDGAPGEPGFGIGLAIVKRVCEQHGWTVTVDSQTAGPARGATFTVDFNPAGA